MDSSELLELLNCARLRRLANFMGDQKKRQIGIPVTPNDDLNKIGANLVLGVLQKEIPRKKMRSYLMKLISFDQIAKILRGCFNDNWQSVMHLAAAQYDLDFIKLLAEKCGEDLFTIRSRIPNDLPICHLLKNNMFVQYNQLKRALDYHISKVPNGVSWIRSSIFNSISETKPTVTELMKDIFERPIVASEITMAEKEAVTRFFRTSTYQRSCFKDLQKKFITIFVLSEPSYFQCQQSDIFPKGGSSLLHGKIHGALDLFEEIIQMKKLTIEDRGYLLSMANMAYDYINGYFPDLTKWTKNKLDKHLHPYIRLLWYLNDVGALPSTQEDVLNIKNDECEKFLSFLAKQATSGVLMLEKYNFRSCNLPLIYKHFINKYLENWFTGPSFESVEDLPFKFPFMDLPIDMTIAICSYLPYITLKALLLTCKRLRALQHSSSIWRTKFEQYFPYDASNKDYSDTSFNIRYKNKFMAREIYGSKSYMYSIGAPSVSYYCDMYSVELIGDEVIYTSKHHNRLTLTNLDTNDHVSVTGIHEPAAARIYNDKVFVMKHNQVEVRDKTTLGIISQFSQFKPRTTLPHFELSDNWLVSSDALYDWGTGQMLDSWDQDLTAVTVRDRICYGINSDDIVIRDLRQSDRSVQRLSMTGVNKFSSVNVYDGIIYTAGTSINIFDMRYLQQPSGTIASRSIGPCDPADYYAIDLVNMNVWGSQVSWDLIDNKWERADICDYYNIVDRVCNGKYLAVAFVGVLKIFRLSASTPFPFGDFKLNRYKF